jgi:subtilisin family serine protease
MPDSDNEEKTEYVFTDEDPSFLEDEGYDVLEKFDFGEVGGFGAKVKSSGTRIAANHNKVTEAHEESVFETKDVEFTPDRARGDYAEIEDINSLHNIPEQGLTGKNITVAVIDSGVDGSHRLVEGDVVEEVNVINDKDGDQLGHGTAVAGQVSAVAPNAEIISVKIFGKQGSTSMDTIMRSYQWLLNNHEKVDVANMSWGATRKINKVDELQNKLPEAGIAPVVAAGNSGDDGGSPALADASLSVGACTQSGEMAPFSSYDPEYDNPDTTAIGANVKLAAAGDGSLGRSIAGPFVVASGTSFSSPIVAGLVARYRQQSDGGPTEDFRAASRDIGGTEQDGHGVLDYSLIGNIKESDEVVQSGKAKVWEFSNGDSMFISADLLGDGNYNADVIDDDEESITIKFTK